jgi:hypothetical protein
MNVDPFGNIIPMEPFKKLAENPYTEHVVDKPDWQIIFEIMDKQYAAELLDNYVEASKLIERHFSEKYIVPLQSRIKELEEELQKERTTGRQEWERLQLSRIEELEDIIAGYENTPTEGLAESRIQQLEEQNNNLKKAHEEKTGAPF